jgi:transposase
MIVVIFKIADFESEYDISYVPWDRIIPLDHQRKEKKIGRPRMDDTRLLTSVIFYFYVPVVNRILFLEALVLQVQYMIDRFQEWRSAGISRRIWMD